MGGYTPYQLEEVPDFSVTESRCSSRTSSGAIDVLLEMLRQPVEDPAPTPSASTLTSLDPPAGGDDPAREDQRRGPTRIARLVRHDAVSARAARLPQQPQFDPSVAEPANGVLAQLVRRRRGNRPATYTCAIEHYAASLTAKARRGRRSSTWRGIPTTAASGRSKVFTRRPVPCSRAGSLGTAKVRAMVTSPFTYTLRATTEAPCSRARFALLAPPTRSTKTRSTSHRPCHPTESAGRPSSPT